MNKNIKRIAVALALIITLGVPMTSVSASGRNHHSRHHHHCFIHRTHHKEIKNVPTNDNSFEYYHNVLGKSKAWYLVNIHKLP
jgi:hypothetical protein